MYKPWTKVFAYLHCRWGALRLYRLVSRKASVLRIYDFYLYVFYLVRTLAIEDRQFISQEATCYPSKGSLAYWFLPYYLPLFLRRRYLELFVVWFGQGPHRSLPDTTGLSWRWSEHIATQVTVTSPPPRIFEKIYRVSHAIGTSPIALKR